jgi:predicted nucleic acid-binding protein
MGTEPFTLDSKILVYFLNVDEGAKHRMAREIVDAALDLNCLLTVQSVSEFFHVARRKRLAPPREAMAAAAPEEVRKAMRTAVDGKASYFDSLLIATAAEAGCTAIITEDGHPGAVLHGVRIVPPFAGDALSPEVKELLGL